MFSQEQTRVQVNFGPTFMSKVFFFFGLAVGMSMLGAWLGLNYLVSYFVTSAAFTYGLIIVEMILILTSFWWSQRRPLNYLLFAAFALITGLTLVPILAFLTATSGGISILLKTLLATTLTFGASAVFGLTTHYNLQGLRGFLFISLIGMIVVGLVGLFMPWSNNFEMIYSGIGVVIFSGYTMYDVQRLRSYPEDRYIDAALQLYLDIFNLFLYILRLISSLNRN
jgi:FtsH-binding integral membrane protein